MSQPKAKNSDEAITAGNPNASPTSAQLSSEVYYHDYLSLDRLLNAQYPESAKYGPTAHDEMLFIIVHQAYELWFKQIIHEFRSVLDIFRNSTVDDRQMGVVISRLNRVREIQELLLKQIDVLETMTPLDFLDFRDHLVPASGFQSVQFKEIEILMGLRYDQRLPADRAYRQTRLRPADRARLDLVEQEPSLFDVTDAWLARMPFIEFKGFDFWKTFDMAIHTMLDSDRQLIENNHRLDATMRQAQLEQLAATQSRFEALLDKQKYASLRASGEFRFTQRAMLAALFINLYRDEPILFLPFRYLTHLAVIDQQFTSWRARHAIMVQRMLGRKIGTGGSSGHEYLASTTDHNRVFLDLFTLSTFLIPRSELPQLPTDVRQAMGFHAGN